ncbi:hypothetical protein B0T22DRAFT_520386 [Podospora appendiculata]|uniref:Cupin 2 conserved barrel domain-containing protein n=1 Tax=Podospora appendiculata TaxID=314037 RepID=A0AAE0X381_9PEZI|nr:hypothetical protein B0T22DRAFT_520386 [Podospora appendiculata]
MVYSWQLWLSPRPLQRTDRARDPAILGATDGVLYNFCTEPDGRRVVQETHYIKDKAVKEGLSGPPLHIHVAQDEFFQVKQGVFGVMTNDEKHRITKDSGPVAVPAGTRHRFWAHADGTEDLIFDFWVDPQDVDHGIDARFMRNFAGYLRDCATAGLAPSVFQLALMMYDSGIILSPPFWVPVWILTVLSYVVANWIAAGLLGYKASYPEYALEPEDLKREGKKEL